jgi:hypothetical protein
LLENRQHFWADVLFHYGVIASLTGHLMKATKGNDGLRGVEA